MQRLGAKLRSLIVFGHFRDRHGHRQNLGRGLDQCQDLDSEFFGILKALFRVRVNRPVDHFIPALRNRRVFRHRPAWCLRHASGEHFIEHDSGGEDVHPLIHHPPVENLRGGIVWSAIGVLFRLARHRSCEAEIRHLHLAVLIDHDVPRLDVAVEDLVVVGVGQSIAELHAQIDRPLRWNGTLVNDLMQRRTFDPLHHQIEMTTAGEAEIIHRHDVRLVHFRHRPSFALEALGEFRLHSEFRRQNFDRYRPVQAPLLRFVNGSHASECGQFFKRILREQRRHFLDVGDVEWRVRVAWIFSHWGGCEKRSEMPVSGDKKSAFEQVPERCASRRFSSGSFVRGENTGCRAVSRVHTPAPPCARSCSSTVRAGDS